jgi:hypothetical protein
MQRAFSYPALCLLAAACNLGKPGTVGELSDTTDATTTDVPTTAGEATTAIEDPTPDTTGTPDTTDTTDTTAGPPAPATGVDVLFVMDNSSSMAPSQQRIVDAIGAFIDPLTVAGLDLRIAVTTTDVGNPRCPSTDPENGEFVASSCRERVPLGEFTSQDIDFSSACLDACAHDTIDYLPTTTAADDTPGPRAWVEWSPGASNVEVPLAEALACVLPQGVAGCGFESPLEGMHRAIARASAPGDANEGFIRDDAHLVVILVTDETDCSYNPDFDDIFTTNKVFWSDPDSDVAPSSSMCWKAGVTCEGGPGTYDDCVATDRDSTGAVTTDIDDAVLFPVGKYTDLLAEQQAHKLAAGSSAKVQVVVIGGVPAGFPMNPLVYQDDEDPQQQALFGVAPGCDHMGITAIPPGRMLEVADAHSPLGQSMYSICQTNLGGPLSAIAASILNN